MESKEHLNSSKVFIARDWQHAIKVWSFYAPSLAPFALFVWWGLLELGSLTYWGNYKEAPFALVTQWKQKLWVLLVCCHMSLHFLGLSSVGVWELKRSTTPPWSTMWPSKAKQVLVQNKKNVSLNSGVQITGKRLGKSLLYILLMTQYTFLRTFLWYW